MPETIKADVLFRNMKKSRNSMAVVLDEYSGMVGIVTMQDLVEELVGDLNDDIPNQDDPEPYIEKVDDNNWNIYGNVALEILEKATGLELATEDYDTFTGMVFDALGAVPADGEQKISLELENIVIQIQKIEAHQIEKATVTVKSTVGAE